jgi:hypothetical protein
MFPETEAAAVHLLDSAGAARAGSVSNGIAVTYCAGQ